MSVDTSKSKVTLGDRIRRLKPFAPVLINALLGGFKVLPDPPNRVAEAFRRFCDTLEKSDVQLFFERLEKNPRTSFAFAELIGAFGNFEVWQMIADFATTFDPVSPFRSEEQVDHPPHYNKHPSGIECIQVVESLPFCLGNAIKYLWRADHKDSAKINIEKAIWYLRRQVQLANARMDQEIDLEWDMPNTARTVMAKTLEASPLWHALDAILRCGGRSVRVASLENLAAYLEQAQWRRDEGDDKGEVPATENAAVAS